MATTSKPKDLRRLMKEQLNKSKKKVDSPLARYNNAGQLFCVLCNTMLKSDLLWDAHIRGTKHKENLTALKSGQSKSKPSSAKHCPIQPDKLEKSSEVVKTAQVTSQSLNKRRNDHTSDQLCSDIPAPKKLKASVPPPNSSGIPSDFFDSSIGDQHMVIDNDETSTVTSTSHQSESTALPTDFFDQPDSKKELEEAHSPTEKQVDKSIPEGFFDDPKLDAKARKVEYKDPAEEEWEKFQKALSTENQVSEAIIHEEEEESRIDRALDEISEQRLYYIRADALRDKQIALKQIKVEKQTQNNASKMSEDSDSDSDDLEEMFNWRAKKALP